MAKVVLSLGDVVLREIRLSKERMTIGRGPHNDIVIDNRVISAEHAVIVSSDTDSFLEDLNSTNGTQINGQPVRRHYLQDGDVVELGHYRVRYVAEPMGEKDEHLSRDGHRQGRSRRSVGVIRVLNGAAQGREILLTKVLTTIGLPGMQVALITHRPDGYSIAHAEGNGCTLINGKPLGCREQVILDGDVIDLAGTQMQFSIP